MLEKTREDNKRIRYTFDIRFICMVQCQQTHVSITGNSIDFTGLEISSQRVLLTRDIASLVSMFEIGEQKVALTHLIEPFDFWNHLVYLQKIGSFDQNDLGRKSSYFI